MVFMSRRKRKPNEIPDYISYALAILRPPERLTVSQWADKYRILDSKTSAEPGPWKTSRVPYLETIMDAANDDEVEEIIFCKSTQLGGTEAANNIIGYIVSQDPSPTLVVYPTLELAEYTSKNRIQPMVKISPATRQKYQDENSKVLELQFDGMYLVIAGANSPASLSSRPCRFIVFDETDKYPMFAGKEADPISLGEERTKTFPTNKKIFKLSTPTLKNGVIWQAWEEADRQMKYFVPCPHCGHYQEFSFKQIKWESELKTPEEAYNTAWYECIACKGVINDAHKVQMVRNGEWRPIKDAGRKRTAFHLNTIYSPWITFGDVARKFVESKSYPEKLMNFINSWLAEPWENIEVKMSSKKVLEKQTKLEALVVPNWALILTAGVDVQKDCFYYTIRAWGNKVTSQNIAHGIAEAWGDIETIMNAKFYKENGHECYVNLCCIDSGDQTDDVYEFCTINQEWAVPVKGSSNPLITRYKISTIDRKDSIANGMRLYIVDGDQYKDMIAGRMNRPTGPDTGSWMVYSGCDEEYADQIAAEEKVTIKLKNGRETEKWQKKGSHVDNHYLDAEVYAALASDLLNIRYLTAEEAVQAVSQNRNQEEISGNKTDWIKVKGRWIE